MGPVPIAVNTQAFPASHRVSGLRTLTPSSSVGSPGNVALFSKVLTKDHKRPMLMAVNF